MFPLIHIGFFKLLNNAVIGVNLPNSIAILLKLTNIIHCFNNSGISFDNIAVESRKFTSIVAPTVGRFYIDTTALFPA